MSWRDTWRETVERFLREVREPDDPERAAEQDPLVAAIAAARREVAELESELASVTDRVDVELASADACERRRTLASAIDDQETAAIAAAFGRRHRERAEVLRRKHDVLGDELALARAALDDLLDLARAGPRRR